MSFQFDWQNRKEDFVKWMFVHLIADKRQEDPKFEKLSVATNGFTDVNITMQVNGIEVDAKNFIESVEYAYKSHAENTAKEIVAEAIPDLSDLQDAVFEAQRALEKKLRESMRSVGVEWYED